MDVVHPTSNRKPAQASPPGLETADMLASGVLHAETEAQRDSGGRANSVVGHSSRTRPHSEVERWDQRLEREGKTSPHNKGYDEAADGHAHPKGRHIVDEA